MVAQAALPATARKDAGPLHIDSRMRPLTYLFRVLVDLSDKEVIMRPITRFTTAITIAAALVGISTASLLAQEVRMDEILDARWGISLNPEAQAHLQMGDEALGNGKYGQARSHYEMAIEIIENSGGFPATPMYRIAASYYFEGKYKTATHELDQLATEASSYGDLVTEVWALADAAWIFGKRGAKIDMASRVDRLRRLLTSPYLPYEVRAEITSKRLGEATTLTRP